MRESLLVFGAFTILTVCSMSINKMAVRSTEQVMGNEVYQVSMALSQKLMYQITSLSFDEKTVGGKYILKPGELTSPAALGPDYPETTVFDDVDDYHGFTHVEDSTRYPGFRLKVRVAYADTANPNYISASQTLLKRVTITVSNPEYLHDPESLTISSLVGYY